MTDATRHTPHPAELGLPEEWRHVAGFGGRYEVSNYGRVRAARTKRIRKLNRYGKYLRVTLSSPDGRELSKAVYSLVAAAFLGPRPEGMDTRHLDGDRDHNYANNLEYGTKSQNTLDQLIHGTMRNGNTGKTHCKRGHEFTPDNTMVFVEGKRNCRTCHHEGKRRRYEAAKLAAKMKMPG